MSSSLHHASCIFFSRLPLSLLPVAPQGEVWGTDWWCSNLTLVQSLCSFSHFFPSASLPLSINSYSITWWHSSFFHTILHSSHLLFFSVQGSSISSPIPCILFFSLFSHFPSSLLLCRQINSLPPVIQKNLQRPVTPLTPLSKVSLTLSLSFLNRFFSFGHGKMGSEWSR